ncbi:MAG: MauE/DoxX family redox-associated membrane protein [Flavobacteriales bacterium]
MQLQKISQLILRVVLAATFLSAVADRSGCWGAPGEPGVAWGNWENFRVYSNSLNRFVPESAGNVLAIVATLLEVLFALLLLLGFKTRFTALGSAALLGLFACSMSMSLGIKAPFDYSVWTGAAAALLLASLPSYAWSLDARLQRRENTQ